MTQRQRFGFPVLCRGLRIWVGPMAPTIVDRLNKEINAGLADPIVRARLPDLGIMVIAGSPADFGKFIADETDKWGKVVKFANIRVK